MHVIATAGHVDHGKSTLVSALTGTDPDRLQEEHRRGLSIELGYCWTSLPPVGDVAFVDVPGHERFISTMLAGIGPVPAVLFVVAADDPWMPQAAEHLRALDALGVSRGVLAVTRADLTDTAPAMARARAELDRTSLRGAPAVAVSGRTGAGLDDLRALLTAMVAALPAPDPEADVRLWADRCFHVRGAGTVVTGTLPAGRVEVGMSLAVGADGAVRVRRVESLGRPVSSATGVARVALNVTGADVPRLDRSSVLVTPGRWWFADVVDVRMSAGPEEATGARPPRVPDRPLLHVGGTSVGAHFRPLGDGLARLLLDRSLPLRIGDRALLRDPGSRQIWGITVLDPAPPDLRRRGSATARAAQLADADGTTDLGAEVDRRGQVRRSLLERIGVDTSALTDPPASEGKSMVLAGDWVLSAARASTLRAQVRAVVEHHEQQSPLDHGMPVAELAQTVGLPDVGLVGGLLGEPLRMANGRVTGRRREALPAALEKVLAVFEGDLALEPFAAPTADRLRELGLDTRALGAAVRAGRLLRVAEQVVLLPGADTLAARWLAELPQPFTTSQARVRLNTSRRVVLPLLAHLDRQRHTQRLEDDRRTVR